MDCHIDRRIVLATESELKNLYNWHLKEIDDAGNQLGADQIPWPYSLIFTAKNLALREFFKAELDEEENPLPGNGSKLICAELTPGRFVGCELEKAPSYSMFGTDRLINDFRLEIRAFDENRPQESCEAWGGISFDVEIDFVEETVPDQLVFYLMVSPERFAHWSQQIEDKKLDQVTLRMGGVKGFYSPWSPSISTDDIKVLLPGDDQKIDAPTDCGVDPPRVGAVREASIEFLGFHEIEKFSAPDTGTPGEQDDGLFPMGGIDPEPADREEKLIELLKSIRNVGWIIVGLIAVMLLRT